MFEWIESLAIHAAEARAVGTARIPADHPLLADHFPGVPILPGSLQIELCAQVAGPLVEEVVARGDGNERWAFLGMVRHATFRAPVPLPAALGIVANATRIERDSAIVQAVIRPGADEVACRVELVMMLRPPEPGWNDAIAGYRARIAALKARARP